MDWRVTLWACLAFFALDLDRGNLSQANTDNFLDDLNLTTNGRSSSPVGNSKVENGTDIVYF